VPDRPTALGSRGQGLLPPESRPNPNRDIPEITPALGCQRVPAGAQISGRARARAAADRVRNGAERRPTACWRLVHPADPGKVAALARAPPPRTAVWLDGAAALPGWRARSGRRRDAGAAECPEPGGDQRHAMAGPAHRLHRRGCPRQRRSARRNANCRIRLQSSASTQSRARRSRTGPAPLRLAIRGCGLPRPRPAQHGIQRPQAGQRPPARHRA